MTTRHNKRLKVPTDSLSIYHSSIHTFKSIAGSTPPTPLNQGIKQCCPLLFNIVLERLIPKLTTFDGYHFQGGGAKTFCLAFADDLCLIV